MLCNFEGCNNKIYLTDTILKCKCGKVFCRKHRFFKQHQCDYEYFEEFTKSLKEKLDIKLEKDNKIIRI